MRNILKSYHLLRDSKNHKRLEYKITIIKQGKKYQVGRARKIVNCWTPIDLEEFDTKREAEEYCKKIIEKKKKWKNRVEYETEGREKYITENDRRELLNAGKEELRDTYGLYRGITEENLRNLQKRLNEILTELDAK